MAELELDLARLRRTADAARDLARQLAGAARLSGELADGVGHERLAARVRDVGRGWDTARERLEGELTAIAEDLESVVAAFRDLDAAQALAVARGRAAG